MGSGLVRMAGAARPFIVAVVAVAAVPVPAAAMIPPACVVAVTNHARTRVFNVTVTRFAAPVSGVDLTPKAIRHPDLLPTSNGGGRAGTTLRVAAGPGDTVSVGMQSITLGQECAISIHPPPGADDNGFSMPGVVLDVYAFDSRDLTPRITYAKGAHGRPYIAAQVTKHHHRSFDEHGTLVRDVKIDPSVSEAHGSLVHR